MPFIENIKPLADVQNALDSRSLAIQYVGVKDVRHPLFVQTANGKPQATVGMWNLYVQLPATQKGTHMSRFIELLEERHTHGPAGALCIANFHDLLRAMMVKLEVHAGRIEVSFPYFIEKTAPVSGVKSLMDYNVSLIGEISTSAEDSEGVIQTTLRVIAPVTSLCPCSQKISDYGAHNQRSHVTMTVELLGDLRIEELVLSAEEEASCELYGLLKRPDEKYVTERAYDNPKFVEDVVRDVVTRLNQDARIGKFTVEVENFESIHNHSAYARIERPTERQT